MVVRITDDDQIPEAPGIYLVFTDAPIGVLRQPPEGRPVYIGKADDGLRRRLATEHHADTGRSTLRRSLAALLKDELGLVCIPRPTRGEYKAVNFTNFSLDPASDAALTAWMERHLTFDPKPSERPGEEEGRLVAEICPALNITGCGNPFADTLKAGRKRCADEARANARR
jgi:hypothetical protein